MDLKQIFGTSNKSISNSLRLSMKGFVCFFLALWLVNISSFSAADVGITGSIEYLDNPRRLEGSSSKEDDLLRVLALDANFGRETERFGVAFNYRASKEDFKNDLQNDRSLIEGTGVLTWKALPEVLIWNLSNTRSNQVLDFQQPGVSDNQQVVDITSTGPTLTLPVGSSNLLTIQLDYALADYEESGRFDQEKTTVNADFTRQFSSVLSGSIRSSYSDTELDDSDIPSILNYELSSASALVSLTYSNFALSLEAGEYTVRRPGVEDNSSPLRSINGRYTLNSFSEISVLFRESVEDLLSDFSLFQGRNTFNFAEDIELDDLFGSSDVGGIYVASSESITYRFDDDARFNFELTFRNYERDFQGSGRDETVEAVFANVGVPIGRRISLNMSLRYSEAVFSQADSLQEREEIRVGVSYRASDQLNVLFSIWNMDQDSKDAGFSFESFNALATVSYRF
ncbi:MAG: hypothetical protein JKY51_11080 [Opitutaceae bacterium]|nr:hypothetical protein [Opitutaceae bacterium]